VREIMVYFSRIKLSIIQAVKKYYLAKMLKWMIEEDSD
jgi:hypothetical protein